MDLKNFIREIKDFPKKGIGFKDISTLLANPEAFSFSIVKFCKLCKGADKIVALDARGFIFGGAVAEKLQIPFIPVRKPGKLPAETISESYSLEYGENILEIHKDSIKKGEKIAIIDDLLATGGTAKASVKLVERLGGKIHSINFLIKLSFLNGEEKIGDYQINNLIEY